MAELSQLGTLRSAMTAVTTQPVAEETVEHVQKIDAFGRAYATGKRKNAVARVWLKRGTGKVVVNGRDMPVYFARPVLRMILAQPFSIVERVDQYDVWCTV